MTIRSKGALGLLLLAAASVATTAVAHTTIVKKNTPDEFAVRTDLAGTSSVVNQVGIPHGCNGKPVKAMAMLFPNGPDPVVVDQDDNPIDLADFLAHFLPDNNIVMRPQPAQVVTWKKITVLEGPVPEGTDRRAFVYTQGKLPTGLLGLFPWRQTYGAIDPAKLCLEKMRMRIPIVNYCTPSETADDRVDAWIGRLTGKFNDPEVVSVGFWPWMEIANPHYDEVACNEGEGTPYYYKVSPSDADIDEFLPVRGYWPDKNGHVPLPEIFGFPGL